MNRLISFLLFALLPMLAHAGVRIEHWTTPAGARVYFVASREIPILDVRVEFNAGSANDPAGKSGLAGLTTGLLDSGVKLGGVGLNEEQMAKR